MQFRIGVDVGGTNTDAVLMRGREVIAKHKTPTTEDVTGGIVTAMTSVLREASVDRAGVAAVMVGTTHFTNAIVERRQLQSVGVLRIGLPATTSVPPLCDWPGDLRAAIDADVALVHGGYEFDGRPISPFDPGEVEAAVDRMLDRGIRSFAITGVFSPVNADQEEQVAQLVAGIAPDAAMTLSRDIGRIGLLERENAAILNACLRNLAISTIDGFERAMAELGIAAPLYLTQNDGTLMRAGYARRFPVLTIASGPTNSMRGAAFLSGLADAIVVDIGGTTTDVGMLVDGFPREASVAVEVGGVRTNFRMPDVISIGLGGGSLVSEHPFRVGPRSVGYQIGREAVVFGGSTLTATDIAVASGLAAIGDPDRIADLDPGLVSSGVAMIQEMIETTIDRVKTSAGPAPVIVVGGGSILVGADIAGASDVVTPAHFEAANAVGAAIAQVSGEVDRVFSLADMPREAALAQAKAEATDRAVSAGADAETVAIVDVEDVPLAYLPGNATRIRVKAVGDVADPMRQGHM